MCNPVIIESYLASCSVLRLNDKQVDRNEERKKWGWKVAVLMIFWGLSLNDRTILFIVILLDKTVSVG